MHSRINTHHPYISPEVVFTHKVQVSNHPSLTFNGTSVTHSEIQEHLEVLLD